MIKLKVDVAIIFCDKLISITKTYTKKRRKITSYDVIVDFIIGEEAYRRTFQCNSEERQNELLNMFIKEAIKKPKSISKV